MLNPTTDWIVALLVGAAMITFNFWYQFDEPSYDSPSEFFSKYKPWFLTSHTQYVRARFGYIFLFLIAYLIFSFVPDIFYALFTRREDHSLAISLTVLPVIIAL